MDMVAGYCEGTVPRAALWPPIPAVGIIVHSGGWNASQQFDDLFIMETKLNQYGLVLKALSRRRDGISQPAL